MITLYIDFEVACDFNEKKCFIKFKKGFNEFYLKYHKYIDIKIEDVLLNFNKDTKRQKKDFNIQLRIKDRLINIFYNKDRRIYFGDNIVIYSWNDLIEIINFYSKYDYIKLDKI